MNYLLEKKGEDFDIGFKEIIQKMRKGDDSRIMELIKKDSEIQFCGYRLYREKNNKDKQQKNIRDVVSRTMRYAARLILIAGDKANKEFTLSELFSLGNIELFKYSVNKIIYGDYQHEKTFKTMKLGNSIALGTAFDTVTIGLWNFHKEQEDDEKVKRIVDFREYLYEMINKTHLLGSIIAAGRNQQKQKISFFCIVAEIKR